MPPRLVHSLILLLTLCASCGYHAGTGGLSNQYKTLSIPYVEGDLYGILTDALVEQMAKSGAFVYKREGGELILEVELLSTEEENIGFLYDRERKRRGGRSIIPVETRTIALTRVQLIERCSGKIVYGPVEIEAFAEFDHNYYFGSDKLNKISLGQVTDIDTARDSVRKPLFRELAKKITRAITHY